MRTQREFVTPTLGAPATLVLEDTSSANEAIAQKANVTTAEIRDEGKKAKLTIEHLRNNVSLISGSGGNVLVLPGRDGKLMVDSGLATSKMQMSKALQSISTDPLQYLINTHWHFDHTDGNAWMNAAGASIVAHEKTLERMQHQQTIPEFEGVYPPSVPAALPTVTFQHAKALEVNGHNIALARYTPAHTDGDISVFFADADVFQAGDTFFGSFYPFIDYNSGGNVDGMIQACRETLALIGPSTIVVGGHGPARGRNDVIAFELMLIEVRSRVATLKQSGASMKEVLARKPSASFDGQWGNGFVSPDLFISLVYRGV